MSEDPARPGGARRPIADRAEFGRELTSFRERAGLTVREVAQALDQRSGTIGGYFSGRHLPPTRLLPALLEACGVGDAAIVEALTSDLIRLRQRRSAVAPYPGLAGFEPEQAHLFFGREEATARLRRRLAERHAAGRPLVFVVGPSGSGKSSLLRAGLVPVLREEGGARVVLFTPRAHPLTELATHLAPGAGLPVPEIAEALRSDPADCARFVSEPLVLVVDQFEETFTTCRDEAERQAFIEALGALTGTGPGAAAEGTPGSLPGPVVSAVLGLRADFYPAALRRPLLATALEEAQEIVRPMNSAQLRRAIVEPARNAGVKLDDGLVELLLRDLAPAARGDTDQGHEDGTLPLLSHALFATAERGQNRQLTVADYQASGGIAGAVAHTADTVYNGLTPEQQILARALFLRLVRLSSTTADVRRRIWHSELLRAGGGSGADELSLVADLFIEQRLITADAETLTITHEALLSAWPRLQGWIESDRDGIRTHHRLTESAEAWHDSGRDPQMLLRGTGLALARGWAEDAAHRLDPTPLEREFLDAGIEHERLERLSARRRTRRVYQLSTALGVVLVLILAGAWYGVQRNRTAEKQETAAASRQTAVAADRVRTDEVGLGAQLSLTAYRIAATPEAVSSLLNSSASPAVTRLLSPEGAVQALALGSRSHLLAQGGADGTVRLWNTTDTRHPVAFGHPLAAFPDAVYAVALSPDEKVLAVAGAHRTVRLWDVGVPSRPRPLGGPLTGPSDTVYSLAFSPDGHTLAAGSADNSVRLWDVTVPGHATASGPALTGPSGYVHAVAFSPDGRVLAAGSGDGKIHLWRVGASGGPAAAGAGFAASGKDVYTLAFSPDGGSLAVGGRDQQVELWNIADPAAPRREGKPLTGATSWINALAYSPDGRTLAVGGSDDLVRVWDLRTRRVTAGFRHTGPVTALLWRDRSTLVSGDADRVTRLWHLPSPVLTSDGVVNGIAFGPDGRLLAIGTDRLQLWTVATGEPLGQALAVPDGAVTAVAFSPDGRTLAIAGTTGTVRLWNIADAAHPVPLGPAFTGPATGYAETVAFSPDGHTLVTGNDDQTLRLWDVTSPAHPAPLPKLSGFTSYVFSVAFSPDGRTLAAGSADHTVRLWDMTRPKTPRPLGRPLTQSRDTVYSVAFSPDGHTLAAGSADHTVRLWDMTRPAAPRLLGRPLTGPTNYVYSVAFSPDGHTLAAGSTDHTVWLWDVSQPAAPTVVATLTGPTDHVYVVSFSPRGHTLAAGSADHTVRLWDTDPAAVASRICAVAGAAITRTEWRQYLPDRAYAPPCAA
ncbi:nSTAND1 domain-containing NTPase [Streptomyces prunicolor]|uniref:Helix-turn-helix domain-containing protein n=1 Tax=Streptomyces prunicolor TaxID=67348 RepID=A0ABU4FDF8_9ACTN|nr:helix-turn-helix domain-containing protein [Streptomyces prunicolor]MDV7218611.1 helix-turn-helix domain-containing protein [Streptomyces prunicolor]